MSRRILPAAGVHRGTLAKFLTGRGASVVDVIGAYTWWIRFKNEDLSPQAAAAFTGWTDSSGNGRDISDSHSATTLNNALDASGFYGVDFTKTDDECLGYAMTAGETADIATWDGMTLYVVYRQKTLTDQTPIGFNRQNDRTEGIWGIIQNSPDSLQMYAQAGATSNYDQPDSAIAFDTNLHVYVWRWTWSAGPTLTGDIFHDGTKVAMTSNPPTVWWHDGTDGGTSEPTAADFFVLGARWSKSAFASFEESNAYMLEAMAAASSHSDADVQAISAALIAKFGIT